MAKSCWSFRSQSWDWGVFSWKLAGFAFLLEEGGKIGGLGGVVTTLSKIGSNLNSMCFSKGWNIRVLIFSRHVMFYFIPKNPRWPCNPQTPKKPSFLGGGSDFTLFRKCAEPWKKNRRLVGFYCSVAQLKIRLRHKCPKSYFSWSYWAFFGHTWWLVLGEVPGALPRDFALASHFYWRNWCI